MGGGGGLGKLPPPPGQRGKRQWLSVTRADPSPLVASFFSPPPPGLLCVCVCARVCVGGWSFQGETSLLCSPRIWNPSQKGSALATFRDWGRGEESLKDTGKMCQHQGQANQSVPGWAQDRSLVREARIGLRTPSLGPMDFPSPSRPRLLHVDPACSPPSPQTCLGSVKIGRAHV